MSPGPYSLVRPCTHCPFRTDVEPFITFEHAVAIRRSLVRCEFPCHETTEATGKPRGQEIHCAGVLIMLEHASQPSQMMRIAERLGLYDRTKLDMNEPVYSDPDEWVDAHRHVRRQRKQ